MTEIIFISGFLIFIGYYSAWFFYGFHPFKVFIGFVIIVILWELMKENEAHYYSIPFIIGIISYWSNPLNFFLSPLNSIRMHFSFKVNLRKQQQEIEKNINQQKRQVEEDLQEQAENLHRQKQDAEERIRKRAENLKREQESFNKQKDRFYKEQQQGKSSKNQKWQESNNKFNPDKLSDVYEILGVKAGASLSECKKAYRRLMSLYHPDKIMQLTGARRQQAEEEAKLINVAWESVKKKLK